MAQSSQSTPTVTANIGGTNNQVNLRDYLNMRVAPFLKKAITDSLDAAPEYPLQWLGENLIHQSMLYEGNPDSTNIKERFLYDFTAPIPAEPPTYEAMDGASAQPPSGPSTTDVTHDPEPVPNGDVENVPTQLQNTEEDAPMSNHVNRDAGAPPVQADEGSRDTEMEGTS